jgi:hypothetical protein
MKFITSFIKHSLTPSRRLATDFSLARQSEQNPSEFSSHEGLRRPVKTEVQTEQPLMTSADFSKSEQIAHSNDIVGSSHQVPPHKIATSEVSDFTFDSPSASTTPAAQVGVKSATFTQSLEVGVSRDKQSSVSPEIKVQVENHEQHQVEPLHLQKSLEEGLSSADMNQQSIISKDHFSIKKARTSKTQIEEVERVNQVIRTDPSSKPLQMDISTATPLNSITSTDSNTSIDSGLQHANIDPQEETISVAVPIKRQATTLPTLNRISPGSAQSNTSKSADTPQVRIGNINILVDDLAAAKPSVKPASTPVNPSILFGLRGL